ncbi:MAG: biopolymer transporter ExbD [Cytophagales bacterium]
MSKVKIKRRGVSTDMTAMCDVAFLLLTFFILTTQFKPDEPVVVDTPKSVSDIKLPEANMILIHIDKSGAVFLGMDQPVRVAALESMAQKYGVTFTDKQKNEFFLAPSIGVQMSKLPSLMSVNNNQRKNVKQDGIPVDSANNELRDWLLSTRTAYSMQGVTPKIAIKADRDTDYKVAKKVIATLQSPPNNINRFNLVTGLKAKPKVNELH